LSKYAGSIEDSTSALELLEKTLFGSSDEISPEDMRHSSQSALFLKLYLRRADSHRKLDHYDDVVRDYTSAAGIKPNDSEINSSLRTAKQQLAMSKRKNYYKMLGLEKGATDSEIKKAYRKLALQYHPGI
jgi:DnaJ homolog subfamily C member 7